MRARFAVAALLAGCTAVSSPGARPSPDDGAAARSCVTGTVGTQGAEGVSTTILRTADRGVVRLDGPEAARIRMLSGALLTACGTSGVGALSVDSFELREVDGMPAYLGTLRMAAGTIALDLGTGRAPIPLADVPEELALKPDARVWVAGAWRRDAFAVRSFGWMPDA